MSAGEAAQWFEQGRLQAQAGDKGAAIQSLNRAVQLRPDFADAAAMLAQMLEETGQLMLAIQMYGYALGVQPKHGCAGRLAALRASAPMQHMLQELFAHANMLLRQSQFAQAEMLYRNALAIEPRGAGLYINLGAALMGQRKLDAALQALLQGEALDAASAPLLNNLGNVYKELHRYDEAMAAYRRAVKAEPGHVEAWVNMGKLMYLRGDHAGAVEALSRALELEPGRAETLAELLHRLNHLCRWERHDALQAQLEQVLKEGEQATLPFLAALYASPEAQKCNAQRWSASHYPSNPWRAQALPADARADGILRIGYVSADFHRHATAYLISELFACHDRARFQVYAYSCGVDDAGPERTRIVQAVDVFRDIRLLDDAAAAQLVAQDGIDILVDLKGYTLGHRMGMMALRPAPISVHYLGYPGTTGADFMDYFIGDAVCCPQGSDAHFTEKLVRLGGSYQINDCHRPLPQGRMTRAELGLPEDAFVFCDMNQVYKITPAVFGAWMRILRAVPGSVLMLLESVEGALDALRAQAKGAGVEPHRLLGVRPAPLEVHVERYVHADLVLDTFPVCGHTTTSDALWCGVPVVALAGANFAGRVSASLLAAVGLEALVAENLAAYEALATGLAMDAAKLAGMKRMLRERRMQFSLFDTKAGARKLEAAFLQMAGYQREGLSPQALVADGALYRPSR
ncbi:MAG: tetratricopeptide repeat protein [Proteobacteria bacterium]|nr:tetratricopeptide repeat protein [Pseudomonadota bacterium]